ncbi:hypothetical protein B0H14DRAFT_2643029 [Mycena olivaceomarginata]|nr:hypothetical protein B0H14DRAFT_2643029 [Mycena olivaceomarginata]
MWPRARDFGHLAENAPDWDVGAWMGTAGVRSGFYRKVVGLGACGTGWPPLLPSIADICACQTISQFGGVVSPSMGILILSSLRIPPLVSAPCAELKVALTSLWFPSANRISRSEIHDAHTVADADKFCLAIEKTEGKWYLSASGLMSHNSIYNTMSLTLLRANAENVWNAMGNPQGYIYATPHIGAALDHVDRDSRWIWMSPILEDIKLTLAGSQPLGMAAFSLPFATPSLILCDNEFIQIKYEIKYPEWVVRHTRRFALPWPEGTNTRCMPTRTTSTTAATATTQLRAMSLPRPPIVSATSLTNWSQRWQLGELVPAVLNLHVQLEIWKK